MCFAFVAASTAGASAARHVIACSAASAKDQTRVGFLKNAGLAAAAAAASVAVPAIAMAEEGSELKVGDEATTDSGLMYKVTAVGKGAKPTAGNTIKAHYTGEHFCVRADLSVCT